MIKAITKHADFVKKDRLSLKLRQQIKKPIIWGLALDRTIEREKDFVAFPYYHHVFDDEQKGFERQLKYLKNFGDFISMDEACHLISETKAISGRYFCLSFDDGFQNCYSNMLDITVRHKIPVIIYLPTEYIDLDVENEANKVKIDNFFLGRGRAVPFLTWEQCKKMQQHEVSFGSHTCNHVNLSLLSEQEIVFELRDCKRIIEEKLGKVCKHFACPFGVPGKFYDEEQIARIAKSISYESVASTRRGKMNHKDDLFRLKRDHLLANWGNYQLKYFFGT
jgi:peptidoglycan/xylan/chitin deacetylase (PgdA/CDA1 family)